MSLDPLMMMFPEMSPYVAFGDNPIVYTDPYGLAPSTGGDDPKKSKDGGKASGGSRASSGVASGVAGDKVKKRSGTPIGKFPQWDEELEYYSYDTENRKWHNKYNNNFRLEKDKEFSKRMNEIGDYAASISKKLRHEKGYITHFSKEDVISERDFEAIDKVGEGDVPNEEGSVYSEMFKLKMRCKTPKGHWVDITIAIAIFQKADEIDGNRLAKVDWWQIENIYTNCFAGALGLIGHMEELEFMKYLEEGYEVLSPKDMQPGDIIYSSSIYGGIGHAMVYLGLDENGKKRYRSYFKLSETVEGTFDEIKVFQAVGGMTMENSKIYRKNETN